MLCSVCCFDGVSAATSGNGNIDENNNDKTNAGKSCVDKTNSGDASVADKDHRKQRPPHRGWREL
jgi:hypothetical protein